MNQDQEAKQEVLKRINKMSEGTFFDYIGGQITQIDDCEAAGELILKQHHLNHLSIVHGGVYAAVLDHVMGCAAYCSRPQAIIVTTSLTIHYTAPIRSGVMKATGKVVHESRNMMTSEGTIVNEQGELMAMATASYRAKNS